MNWRDAPVYVDARALCRWTLERARTWPEHPDLSRAVSAAATDLVVQIAWALTFPLERAAHLASIDRSIVRQRELLRIAADLGLLSQGGLRYASGRLAEIGRMVGGWRKRVSRSAIGDDHTNFHDPGEGPPAATTV